MSGLVAWCRLELRRRWRPLLGLALLVAFSGTTVMTTVAGARRGSSAVERLTDRTLPATAMVLPNEPGFDWRPVRALPEVEALTTFVVGGFDVEDPAGVPGDTVGFPPADAEVWRTIERPVVLAGRLPDPHRADEVVVSARFRSHHGRGVGGTVTLRLYAPEQVDVEQAGGDPGAPDGPVVEATIVGVIRSPWFSDVPSNPLGALVPSPGLFAAYRPNLLGADEQVYVNALVRLRDGEAGIARFKQGLEEVTGRANIDVSNLGDIADHLRDVTGFEANSLLAFALAAAAASVFLVGQAVARHAASAAVDLDVLTALGLTRAQLRLAAAAGPTLAAIGGIVLAAGCAILASRWFPVGSASLFEPEPGNDVDAVVMATGVVGVPLLVAVGSMAAAAAAFRGHVTPSLSRRGRLAAATASAPVPVAVGTRFALDPGRGRRAVPVRPALFGAVVGVAGVVGALTFSAGVSDATSSFERFGQTYDLSAFFGLSSEDFGPADEALAAIAGDADVAAVNDARMDVAQAESDVAVSLYTLEPSGEQIEPIIAEGRTPSRAGEIALGLRTADALDVAVGDTVELTGSRGVQQVAVTGLAFLPAGPHNDYASGGWVTPQTYDRLFDGFKFHFGLVAVRPGVDPDSVAARLGEATGIQIAAGPMIPPEERAELRQVRALPLLLAAFLAALALGAVGHALASTARRRRHDLAVLRALGMTREGTWAVLLTQATIVAVLGFLAGIPLGVAAGRAVWRAVADSTPVVHVAPAAWTVVLLAPPIAVLAANLLAAWPSHRASSMRLGDALRAE